MFIHQPLNLAEQNRLQQLRRDSEELAELERKEALAREVEQARREKAQRNADRRAEFEKQCADAEVERLKLNCSMLPDLKDMAAYRSLPDAFKRKYMTAFGPEFLEALEVRSKAGLSQQDWDKLIKANPVPQGSLNPPEPEFEL